MANITIDLSDKACSYVEGLYSNRIEIMRTCESVMNNCKTCLDSPEIDLCYLDAQKICSECSTVLGAIDDALSALHLAIDDGRVFSDGWPSNFNRIRRFISAYEGTSCDGVEEFRAVLSAFGFIYSYDKDAGIIIRYTSRPEER